MSLTKPATSDMIKKQFFHKVKANIDVFSSLVAVQLFGLLLSFNPIGSSGGGSNYLHINITYYSVDYVVVFTMFWAFITAILLTTKMKRNEEFVFITNRAVSTISNICFLLTASAISGITAMLTTFSQKVLIHYIGGVELIIIGSMASYWLEMLLGMVVAILNVFLFSVIGYLVGMLVQLHKLFAVILPTLFFGLLFTGGQHGPPLVLTQLFDFFYMEPSFLLFIIKICVTVTVLVATSVYLSNRLEVRI